MKKLLKCFAGVCIITSLAFSLLTAPYGSDLSAEAALEEEMEAFEAVEEGDFLEEEAIPLEAAEEPFLGEEPLGEAALTVGEEILFSDLGAASWEFTDGAQEMVGASGSGFCGENVRWTYSDSLLVISGSGPMKDYDASGERPGWFEYADELATLVVGDGVTKIGDYAFADCANLRNVALGGDLEEIGDWAFMGCTGLGSVVIPDKVVTLGYQAFYRCQNLTKAELGRRVISIYEDCFLNCSSLKSIYLPKALSNVEFGAFDGCDQLTDVYYEGTKAQWDSVIVKGDNGPLQKANLHYNFDYVTPTPVPSITLNMAKKTLYVGSSQKKVTLTATREGLTNDVQFSSSDPSVATVSKKGVVKAVKAGKAEITAKVDQYGQTYKATCQITVKNPKVTVKSKLTVKKGKTAQLKVTTKPSGTITYSSSNEKVATVSKEGLVAGLSAGKATIKVKCNGVTKKVKVTVK